MGKQWDPADDGSSHLKQGVAFLEYSCLSLLQEHEFTRSSNFQFRERYSSFSGIYALILIYFLEQYNNTNDTNKAR